MPLDCPHRWTHVETTNDGVVKLQCRKCGFHSRLSLDMFVELISDNQMPVNTMLCGNTVMFNVGGPSPAWVQDLSQTKQGTDALIRLLRVVVNSHHN